MLYAMPMPMPDAHASERCCSAPRLFLPAYRASAADAALLCERRAIC